VGYCRDLAAAGEEAAGGYPEDGGDGEGEQEEVLCGVQVEPGPERWRVSGHKQATSGQHSTQAQARQAQRWQQWCPEIQMELNNLVLSERPLPDGYKLAVERVVVALEGVLARLVAAVAPVLHEEGCALKPQTVHALLRVDVQLGGAASDVRLGGADEEEQTHRNKKRPIAVE
jgi:hypothetical protein